MKEFFQKHWNTILSLIIGLAIGVLINIPTCKKIEPKIEYIERHDTVTVEKERIVEKTKIKYIDRVDTFYVKESGDTVEITDLPIEHKIYEDTIKNDSTSTEVKIEYSGYAAQVDGVYIRHNYLEKQETIIQQSKRVGWVWFIGFAGGVSGHVDIPTKTVGWGPSAGLVVGVGIGGTIK